MFPSDVLSHNGSSMQGKSADLINAALRIAHLIQRIPLLSATGIGTPEGPLITQHYIGAKITQQRRARARQQPHNVPQREVIQR